MFVVGFTIICPLPGVNDINKVLSSAVCLGSKDANVQLCTVNMSYRTTHDITQLVCCPRCRNKTEHQILISDSQPKQCLRELAQ